MYKLLLLISFIIFFSISASAQDKIVETKFEVSGNCGMCEARIETAASLKGVKLAEWNKETQMLKVIYRRDKVEIIDIHKAVAAAGHDTSIIKAEDADYDKIPYCCSYRENKNIH